MEAIIPQVSPGHDGRSAGARAKAAAKQSSEEGLNDVGNVALSVRGYSEEHPVPPEHMTMIRQQQQEQQQQAGLGQHVNEIP
ncbi:MAG: hypothetical protein WCT39_06240 [Candidatus Margulisiibacteriota bacterium]